MAIKNVALPHGKSKKTTKSALVVRERTAIGRQPGSRTFDSVANLACSDLSNPSGRTLSQVVAPSCPSLRWLGWQYLIPDRARLASTYQFSSAETGSM
jgi:ribosomal protein L14